MAKVLRFDQGTLRKPEVTPQGFLKVEGLAARAGVLEYRNDDGSISRELRLPEDVFAPAALAGYEGASLTHGHPTVLVDVNNVRTLEAGTATAARRDGDWVAVPMVIKDKKLITDVQSGKTGLSAGYKIRLDKTPGVHPVYGRYDAIQRDIEINHLAVAVSVPRAGDAARIRLDDMGMECAVELVVLTSSEQGHQHTLDPADTAGCTSHATAKGAEDSHRHEWVRTADGSIVIAENAGHTHTVDNSTIGVRTDQQIDRSDATGDRQVTRGNTMDKDEQIRLLNQQLSEAKERAIKSESELKVRTDERDALSGQLAVAKQKQEETQTRLDSGLAVAETEKVKEMQTRLDEKDAEITTLKSSIPALVKKRGSLVSKARAIMGDDYRADSIDDRAIQEACIRRLDPKADLSKQSDAHVEARFDALYEGRVATATSLKRASQEMAVVRKDAVQEPDPFDPLHNGVGVYASPHARQKGA